MLLLVMNDLLNSAWLLFDSFKGDSARSGSRGRDTSADSPAPPSHHSNRRSGYDPNQQRGRDGRWIDTGRSNSNPAGSDDKLFDEDSAIGRAYKRQQEELAAKEAAEKKNQPPKDVESEDLGRGGVQYTHQSQGGNKLEVVITPVGDGSSKNVDFMINGSMDKAENLAPEESNRISIKIAKIMQFDASQRQDGERYQTAAYTGDSDEYAAVRTYAYEKIAKFSRPVGGEPGGDQFAIVKNGKLEPDLKRLKEEEDAIGFWDSDIKENVEMYTGAAEEYRRGRKKNDEKQW